MTTYDVLLQEELPHTGTEGVNTRWADELFDWRANRRTVTDLIVAYSSVPELATFERAFIMAHSTVVRLRFLNSADRVVERLTRIAGLRTEASGANPATETADTGGQDTTIIGALIDDLVTWLDLTYDEISRATHIGRSTLFYWRKPGNLPRPTSARPLYRLHAAISLLVKRFGLQGARAWLQAGTESAWEMMLDGDLEGLEDRLKRELFRQSATKLPRDRVLVEEVDWAPLETPTAPRMSRAHRGTKRGRPRKS